MSSTRSGQDRPEHSRASILLDVTGVDEDSRVVRLPDTWDKGAGLLDEINYRGLVRAEISERTLVNEIRSVCATARIFAQTGSVFVTGVVIAASSYVILSKPLRRCRP